MFAFAGPAYLVSVGYMDPGNWATDIEGGARFGYQLLWVLVFSNLMAILLQTLAARLGIITGRDLAQVCRDTYSKPVALAMWALCEIAVAACDLAELLGAAIGLNLLFGLPLLAGVVLTATDTLFVLWFGRLGIRVVESIILGFITLIGGCFIVQIVLARPEWGQVVTGLVPRLNGQSLYVAIGILGATVMPHNLYLHSSLVQTRRIGAGDESKRDACRFNFFDSAIALNGALLINAAILIMAAATFHRHGVVVTEIQQAHKMLEPLLGTTLAGVAFAVALLCSGQSSTITGTMAGQVVMEGFLDIRMRPWLRRLVTRSLAVIPAAITIWLTGDQGAFRLLILSQVILSLQLPFAVIPLVQFTSDKRRMGAFANAAWVKALAWTAAVTIVALNVWLAGSEIAEWARAAPWSLAITIPLALLLIALMGWIIVVPRLKPPAARGARLLPATEGLDIPEPVVPAYHRILVPLDHTRLDLVALGHALALARSHQSIVFLMHVEEGVASRVYGDLAETAEVQEGRLYFEQLRDWLGRQGVDARLEITSGVSPKTEIVRLARSFSADLIVMGAHGHKGLQDIVFGATINEVRHAAGVPVLIVCP
jgi:manganese transport protein